jgi:hypothetical protein
MCATGTSEVLAIAQRLRLDLRMVQQYGPKPGEMSVVKLYADAAGGPFRCPAP